jgi:amino acid adenylation domain-containing protein
MKSLRSIHATFTALALRLGDRIAVVDPDQTLTYAELARRSDGIANHLLAHGIARGDRVGLYAQRSIDAVIGMLGILMAGGVYVPFDPSYPPKLLRFVYEDCRPAAMLIQSAAVGADGPFWEGTALELGALSGSRADAPPVNAPLPDIGPDDPAYIMYTSGSTGRPKGVLIPHRGVVRLVIDNPYAAMGPDEVNLQLAPLAFDASTFEIWGALLNGGRLAILGTPHPSLDDVAASIARHGVTTLWLTAGLFHLMVDHRLEGLKPLKQLLAGGDVLSPAHIARAQRGLPDVQLINGYGPTENTTFTCCYRIPRSPPPAAAIPIGTPIAHTQVYILDESGRAVAEGEEGELFAGGAGVALGYWNRPELTAEKFVADPFDPPGTALMYRTGDRVRRRPDGNIEFLGRVDRQVKINGKRVELDEIEATLRRAPEVEDAAVICPPAEVGARKVHAYIKFRLADDTLPGAVRAFLQKELPDHMVPATFTVLDALPLSPTGKIDRSRLPLPSAVTPGSVCTPDGASPATATAIEAELLTIWGEILGTRVGLDDNFFDLGGTSLQLIAVHARIVASMKTDITVVDLFQYPSIAALALRLTRRAADSAPPPAAAAGGPMNADERARRQQAALARARSNPRRNVR